ncbi:AAA family ATPase [Rhodococcus sp. 06-1477-1A]|uniref:AAA family ATPase n=1 Tax=Rhodococcus sp. 06-1477-1A TaxID=2022497 RepID=UPI000B9AF6D3|nr:AAA family ATPase [Rhodococcus sp. 06-1477-1A]OZD43513.1 hypothetical protein CH264_17700 [Rhodococcus sp. 06-1477-1A]
MTAFDWSTWNGDTRDESIPLHLDFSTLPQDVRELAYEEQLDAEVPEDAPKWVRTLTGAPSSWSWTEIQRLDEYDRAWNAAYAEQNTRDVAGAKAAESQQRENAKAEMRLRASELAREKLAREKADAADLKPFDDMDMSAAEFIALPTAPALVAGVLDAGTVFRVLGESGNGKSFVALDLAMSIATGRTWAQTHEVPTPGLVYYLVTEGFDGFKARMVAWAVRYNDGVVPENLRIIDGAVQLLSTKFERLVERAVERRPAALFIDTQHRVTVGIDENSNTDAAMPLDRLNDLVQRSGVAVGLVHHTPKDGERGRGASAWEAAMDVELLVTKPKGTAEVTVTNRKAKDEADGVALGTWEITRVQIPRLGHREHSAVLAWIDPMEAAKLDAVEAVTKAYSADEAHRRWCLDVITADPGHGANWYAERWTKGTTHTLDGTAHKIGKKRVKATIAALASHGWIENAAGTGNPEYRVVDEAERPPWPGATE